jgi:hypothetical protein
MKMHHVPVDSSKTPTKTSSTSPCYTFSLFNIIQRTLLNPVLRQAMHFGPGQLVDKPTELWEGDLWCESPLFGREKIVVNNSNGKARLEHYNHYFNRVCYRSLLKLLLFLIEYWLNDIVQLVSEQNVQLARIRGLPEHNGIQKLLVDCLLTYDGLPYVFKTKERYHCSEEGEVWLTDDTRIVDTSQLLGKPLKAWMTDTQPPSRYDIRLCEIIYKIQTSNGPQYNIRPISKRHHLPSETGLFPCKTAPQGD